MQITAQISQCTNNLAHWELPLEEGEREFVISHLNMQNSVNLKLQGAICVGFKTYLISIRQIVFSAHL